MIFNVYSLFDCKMEEFSEPFIQREAAVDRSLNQLLSKSSIPKSDLTLWCLGTWDSELGILKVYDKPSLVSTFIGLSETIPSCLYDKGVVV